MPGMNIVIVNTQPVPSSGVGAASVNRILSYAKGLIGNGNVVSILSTANNSYSEWQVFEGVRVKHLGRNSRNLIGTSFRLLRELSKEEKDIVIFVTSNYGLILLLELYCKIAGVKIVNERSEYPFVLMSKNYLKRFFAPLYVNTAYKMLDGMILMTKPLMEYYKPLVGRKCRFIEVPMTVDSNRFSTVVCGGKNPCNSKYIAYCGNMGGNKDGLKNLLASFSIVEQRGLPLTLLLIGGTNNKQEYDELICLNKQLGNKHVVFYGKAERDDIPELLKGATMLVLARPSSLQSSGGFPTKLGEYLCTGLPVVVTSVGDIPYYLKDRQNAYVVSPDDNTAFADAICYVWNHPEEAMIVGKKGQELAMTIFNGEYQARRIEAFLKEVICNNS